jgi:hypothetical protein
MILSQLSQSTLPLSISLSLGLLKLISSIVLRGKAKLDFPTRIIQVTFLILVYYSYVVDVVCFF